MRCMVMGKRGRQGQLTVPILTIPKMVTKLISKYLASTGSHQDGYMYHRRRKSCVTQLQECVDEGDHRSKLFYSLVVV